MKEEISELVKESMKNEAEEEDEFEVEDEIETEDESEEDEEFESEDESEEDEEEIEFGTEDDDSEEDEFDMTNLSDMGGDDEFDSMEIQDLSNEPMDKVLKAFKEMKPTDSFEIKKEGDFIHLKDEDDEYLIQDGSEDELEEVVYEIEMNEEDESDEVVYEIEMDEDAVEDEEFGGNNYDFETMEEEEEYTEGADVYESFKAKVGTKGSVGKPKFSYEKSKGGFNEKKSHANPTKGTSKPKFEFKEGEMFEMGSRTPKLSKEEAKEASRTYGFGSKKGRGLRKGVTPNRNLTFESREITEELEMLRAKNEEYRKALNMFRDKLNEVAVFNSNLAYATRLFTEHSTTKKEKINILRRFDDVETLKESKNLYKSIKDELNTVDTKSINESVATKLNKSVSTGSSTTLIESKTYENPQFLRMKDLMGKLG
jgi:hypothetical protein